MKPGNRAAVDWYKNQIKPEGNIQIIKTPTEAASIANDPKVKLVHVMPTYVDDIAIQAEGEITIAEAKWFIERQQAGLEAGEVAVVSFDNEESYRAYMSQTKAKVVNPNMHGNDYRNANNDLVAEFEIRTYGSQERFNIDPDFDPETQVGIWVDMSGEFENGKPKNPIVENNNVKVFACSVCDSDIVVDDLQTKNKNIVGIGMVDQTPAVQSKIVVGKIVDNVYKFDPTTNQGYVDLNNIESIVTISWGSYATDTSADGPKFSMGMKVSGIDPKKTIDFGLENPGDLDSFKRLDQFIKQTENTIKIGEETDNSKAGKLTKGKAEKLSTDLESSKEDGNIVKEIVKQYLLATIAIIVGINIVAVVVASVDNNLTNQMVKNEGIIGLTSDQVDQIQTYFQEKVTIVLSVIFSLLDEGSDIAELIRLSAWETPLFVISKTGQAILEFVAELGFEVVTFESQDWADKIVKIKATLMIILIGAAIYSGIAGIGSLIISAILGALLNVILIEL